MSRPRAAPWRLLLPLLSLAIFALATESSLRLVYRDAGQRTLGGPGGRTFEYVSRDGDQRGRLDVGPRQPGVPRVMVLGDSITYGQGVRDWRDTWPEKLATAYERQHGHVEMAVFAMPGRDLPQHLVELERWGPAVKPDVLIYQWYVNDVEVISHRPDPPIFWHRWPLHEWLDANSYAYYVVNRLAAARIRSSPYLRYITSDFEPGTLEWSEFERYFHTFATVARATAPRRIVLLYPQVPYGTAYPLAPLHERMVRMAGPHWLDVPPASWVRYKGALVAEPAARWRQVVEVPSGLAGPVIETREYVFEAGSIDLTLTVAVAPEDVDGTPVGSVDLVDAITNLPLASQSFAGGGTNGELRSIAVRMELPDLQRRSIRFRVSSTGTAAWRMANLAVGVDYGMTVVDLAAPLNTFNTHASVFDAHPNEAAHQVIAEQAYHALQSGGLP
ncbi:MAG: hypothetical protein ACT4QD_24115 [Acidobacteriota bacterium]